MFGFSLTKLLFTVAVILLVWYGYRWFRRVQEAEERRDRERLRGGARAATAADSDAETMIMCPTCGTYMAASASRSCGRADCPYAG